MDPNSPVYALDDQDDGRKRQIARGEVNYLAHLSGQNFASGFWVADFRIEVPVEKSWLVGREPIAGLASEEDCLRLAERLARRRNRPALANIVVEGIVQPLRKALQKLGKTKRASILDPIEELRLSVDPNRLQPRTVQLIVITKDNQDTEALVEWFDGWWCNIQGATEEAGLTLISNRYTTLGNMTAREYTSSVALDFSHLSPDE